MDDANLFRRTPKCVTEAYSHFLFRIFDFPQGPTAMASDESNVFGFVALQDTLTAKGVLPVSFWKRPAIEKRMEVCWVKLIANTTPCAFHAESRPR